MNSRMRTLYIILLDYVTLLICYLGCRVVFTGVIEASFKNYFMRTIISIGLLLVVYPLVNYTLGVYKIVHRFAQSTEYLKFFFSFIASGLVYFICMRIVGVVKPDYAHSGYFLLLEVMFSALAMLVTRIVYNIFVNREEKLNKKIAQKNTLIVGCGQACLMLLNEVKHHKEFGINPVVAVDTDVSMLGRMVSGIKVEGTDDDIPELCKKHNVSLIVIAIPSADNVQRARILSKCDGVNAEIKMLPRVADFTKEGPGVIKKLRDFTADEVLGREPIDVNDKEISAFIKGQTVLVTGGGGSIGSEICRQIAKYSPKKLVIVDIYENNAYDIQQELRYEYGNSLDFSTIIASVRDYDRMSKIMETYKPDIVIHAAAHKHVPLMEKSPQEAIKNNVFGTYNTARAAIKNNVGKFILISTDKAVNPTNIMGASKRLCEMVIQTLNGQGTKFSAVRFGNVLGSNGSVIPLFKKQIEAGGPVTVTHPDIIRFFMTIPEACELVLLASTKAQGGEIFVLNMGTPVKIADLARKVITLSGKIPDVDIKIEYTGLRPGEKLYEELMMNDEHLEHTQNNKIFVGHFVDFDKEKIKNGLSVFEEIANDNSLSEDEMLKAIEDKISEFVPTFHRTEA